MWQIYSSIGTLFFVFGIVLLKLINIDPISSSILLCICFGTISLCYILLFRSNCLVKTKQRDLVLVFLAGVLYFIGFPLWTKALQQADNISVVSTVYYGVEVALLLLVSLFLFKKKTPLPCVFITIVGCGLLVYASLHK